MVKKQKPNCYKCMYRGAVPGDAHSCCKYPGNETGMFAMFDEGNKNNWKKLEIQGHDTGLRGGWFMWPVNFDPVWLISCNGFKEEK